jgi:hypothetical protein
MRYSYDLPTQNQKAYGGYEEKEDSGPALITMRAAALGEYR